MLPDDFTFAMLAAAVRAAGGRVHIPAREILMENAASMVDVTPDGAGGVTLSLHDRPNTNAEGLERALDYEHQDEAR